MASTLKHTEIDTGELRKVLETFSEELASLSRKRSSSPSESGLLSDREKQLQAAVGIAMVLLNNYEFLVADSYTQKSGEKLKSYRIATLTQEIDRLKEDLLGMEDKNKDLTATLVAAEEELLHQRAENAELMKQLLHRQVPVSEPGVSDDEIKALCEEYASEIALLKQSNQAKFRANEKLMKKLHCMQDDVRSTQLRLARAENDRKSTSDLLKEQKEKLEAIYEQLSVKEQALQTMNVLYSKALIQIKALEEELQMAEDSAQAYSTRSNEHNLSSLKEELDFLEDKGLNDDVNNNHQMTADDSCKEFFILATQSVKMNSKYMDAICTIPTQALYEKAQKLNIPFHQWYEWIKQELHEVYISLQYQEKLKERAPKKKASQGNKSMFII